VNPSGGYPDCAKAAYCDEAARPPVGEELIRLELFQGSKMKDTKVKNSLFFFILQRF
jgi:hypothetical protein